MERAFESFMKTIIRHGSLEVVTAGGSTFRVGDGAGEDLAVRFSGARAQVAFMSDPELAFGELYMDGDIEVVRGDLLDVMRLALQNIVDVDGGRWVRLLQHTRIALRRWRQNNNLLRSRENVAHHYDLDAKLYSLFLDTDRQYSCAYFEHPDDSLEEAQLAKKRHIAAKLCLEPGQKVLDIGCGWGGMALYLADYCGVDVTGVTLSDEQMKIAKQRSVERRLAGHVDFRLQDYRHVPERFDRIVSVGMFEHVGVGYFDAYFKRVAELLTDDGLALIHTIGRTDGPGATNPWIAKYIFPGGYIPAMSEVLAAIERSGLIVIDIEVLRLHYAETLAAWRKRFLARRKEAAALYDERFCRMWDLYLAGSEAGFRIGQQVVFQFQLARKVDTVPLTRDYISERERDLRAIDHGRPDLRLAGE